MATIENRVSIEDVYDGQTICHEFKHLGPLEPIDEVEATEFDEFEYKENYFRANRPLVIRNALGVLDFGDAYANWSLSYLAEKCGSNRVHVRRNTLKDDYKTGQAYMVQETEFRTYLNDLLANNSRSTNSYLAVQNLKKAFPQVCHELKMPVSIVEKLHAGPFLWIARDGHYEYTHMDPDDNVLIVLKGRKKVRLYGCDVMAMNPNELGSKGRTLQSRINCDHPTYGDLTDEQRERFANVKCQYCLLKEGDLLYFPAFWWHQVTSPVLTISVNCFFGDDGDTCFSWKLLRSSQRDAFLYWLFNIIQQNRVFPSFRRTLVHLKGSIRNFLFKQWHEMLDDDQLDIIHEAIIARFDLSALLTSCQNDKTLKPMARYPPELKIRGLLMRSKDQAELNDDDDNNNEEENEEQVNTENQEKHQNSNE